MHCVWEGESWCSSMLVTLGTARAHGGCCCGTRSEVYRFVSSHDLDVVAMPVGLLVGKFEDSANWVCLKGSRRQLQVRTSTSSLQLC